MTEHYSKRPEYRHWVNMISRCEYDHPQYVNSYKAKGITVCKEWRSSFRAFFEYMGERPSPGHSLDRINGNGNYEPGNVRWATHSEQMRNYCNNHLVTAYGREMTLAEAVELSGIKYNTVLYRLKRHWPVELALSEPVHKGKRPARRVRDAA